MEIGSHQLVKEMIAQMESDYQASRLLWMRAGWLKNVGRRNTRETGLAKWFSTVASERAASDAVQIHGANGYSDEYPVGRFYRNCKGAVIYEGTREIHKLMQADYVLGYRSDRPTRCELPPYEAVERERSNPIDAHRTLPISPSTSCASSKQAAIACAQTMGQGDRHRSDHVAVEAMRREMDSVPIDGTIVIGEGERDEAPMLYIGEKVGMAQKSPNGRRYPAGGYRRRSARRDEPVRDGCAQRPGRARGVGSRRACSMRLTCTWKSWSSGRARAMSSISMRRCGSICVRLRRRSGGGSRTSWSSSWTARGMTR